MQIDHSEPWKPGVKGQSRVGNYDPMTQRHHNLKTHEHWDVKQPFPGIYLWRDPGDAFYLVDHTGTRSSTNPPDHDARTDERALLCRHGG